MNYFTDTLLHLRIFSQRCRHTTSYSIPMTITAVETPQTTILPPPVLKTPLERAVAAFGESEGVWWNTVRIGICRGVSTNSLPREKRELWWAILKAKIVNRIGTALFDQPTKGKYGLFV